MGLFDNLFKSKPTPGEEGVVEAARRITEAEKAKLLEAEKAAKPPAQKSPGSGNRAAHAPVARAYSPRSLGQAVAPPRAHAPGKGPQKAVRFGAAAEGGRPQEIRLLLDDVLPRIPPDLLNGAPRDGRREVRFRIEDVTADIARGRAAVALARIAEQFPEIFKTPIAPDDGTLIRLPLQKLVEQIGFLPMKPPPDGTAPRPVPLPPAGALDALPSGSISGSAPNIFKPIATSPIEPPQAPAVSVPPPVLPAIPRVPEVAAPPATIPPGGSESQESPKPQPVPVEAKGTSESLLAAPDFQGACIASDAKIYLSLAAILRNCPKELICAPLPPIDETVRIPVAFASIEKQLGTGQVEISSVRFVFALPPHLQHCFEAREGVRIPLPLDEVLRNLPDLATAAGTQTEAVPPPVPTEPLVRTATPALETGSAPEVTSSALTKEPGNVALTPDDEHVASETKAAEPTKPEDSKVTDPETAIAPSVASFAMPTPTNSTAEPEPVDPSKSTADPAAKDTETPQVTLSDSGLSLANPPEPQEKPLAPENTTDQLSLEDTPDVASPPPASPLPSLTPPVVTTLVPPRLFGGVSAGDLRVTIVPDATPAQAAPTEIPAAMPLLGRIVPPPPIQLTPPPSSFVFPAAPAENPAAPTEKEVAEQPPFESRSLVASIEPPSVPRGDATTSPFVSPPPFAVPPPPVLSPAAPVVSREASPVDPPPSPILPVRLVTPPTLRPFVAPPPLFGVGLGEDQFVPEPITPPVEQAAPEPPAPPPPPPPLELSKAREALGLSKDAELAAVGESLSKLPGVHGCLITVRHETADTGEIPREFDRAAARELASRLASTVAETTFAPVQHVTVFTAQGCMSVFARGEAVICALHRTRAFLPGVCDRITAAVEALEQA